MWAKSLGGFLVLVVVALGLNAQTTFDQWKGQWLGQKVLLITVPEFISTQWEMGSIDKPLSSSYFGAGATVVNIQPESNAATTSSETNALGEKVAPDASETYFRIWIRFDDGTVADKTAYPNILTLDLLLASVRDSHEKAIQPALPSFIGTKVYATALSNLYPLDSTLPEVASSHMESGILTRGSAKHITDVPFLVPLTVTEARYVPQFDMVVFKIALPDGRQALVSGGYDATASGRDNSSVLANILGSEAHLLPKLPDLPLAEIDAIRKVEILKGMSENGLLYSIGLPDHTNDWGDGGYQLIFFEGKLVVYLNHTKDVTNWQQFDN